LWEDLKKINSKFFISKSIIEILFSGYMVKFKWWRDKNFY